MPRKYDMSRRAAEVEATRRRIVEATMVAHNEQGIAGTSLQDVARRADVALGTVYRHFPTTDDLVRACGTATIESLTLPDPAVLDGVRGRRARVGRLVSEISAFYREAATPVRRAREAQDRFAFVADAVRFLEGTIDEFVGTALEPLGVEDERARTVRAVLDPSFWDTLHVHGLDDEASERELLRIVSALV
jgi:AcrR family transcriptional regulator